MKDAESLLINSFHVMAKSSLTTVKKATIYIIATCDDSCSHFGQDVATLDLAYLRNRICPGNQCCDIPRETTMEFFTLWRPASNEGALDPFVVLSFECFLKSQIAVRFVVAILLLILLFGKS
jgi:hypothetical protein